MGKAAQQHSSTYTQRSVAAPAGTKLGQTQAEHLEIAKPAEGAKDRLVGECQDRRARGCSSRSWDGKGESLGEKSCTNMNAPVMLGAEDEAERAEVAEPALAWVQKAGAPDRLIH